MNHISRRLRWRAGVVIASMGVAVSGLVVSASGPAIAGTTPPPLDHFLCYHSTEIGLKAPPNVLLKNIIQPVPFAPNIGAASVHCNPANKSVPVALFPAKNPMAHLLCFNLSYAWKPTLMTLKNQFGNAIMKTTGGPTSLCLPTWKDVLGPPNMTPKQPPNLDHFTCYPLVPYTSSTYKFIAPVPTKVEDEFSAPNYIAEKIGTANLLCVPTTKIVAGVAYSPMTASDYSLVCFPGVPTPIWKQVYDQNQFGTGRIFPTTTKEALCLPSTAIVG